MVSKVAVIQMTSTCHVEENLQTVKRLLKEASEAGAMLAVLPEMFPLQSPESTDKLGIAEVLGRGMLQDFLSAQAAEHHLWIVGGTIPIQSDETQKVYATSLVFNDKGQQVAHYHKMHLFDVNISETERYNESATTKPGHEICLVDTPIGKLGLAVCYDLRFPEMFRCLFNQGAEIFVIPSAFTEKTGRDHFEILMRARAIENLSYVMGACQVGEHESGRKTYGHSMIISPWGEILSELADGEGIVMADIDLTLLKKMREDFPVKNHQKMCLKEWKIG